MQRPADEGSEGDAVPYGQPMTQRNGRLFDGPALADWLEGRWNACLGELERLPIKQVLEQRPEVTAGAFESAYRVEPIVLRREDWHMDEAREMQVLGKGGHILPGVRFGSSRSQGYGTVVHVPFEGDAQLLLLSVPVTAGTNAVGEIGQGELRFRFEWARDDDPLVQMRVNGLLDAIEEPYLQAQAEQIGVFNDGLVTRITEALVDRRDAYLRAQHYLSNLRIPVFPRADAPRTFAAPGIQRRSAPQVKSSQPGEPLQAVLADELYEHIIEVIVAMARGMERTAGDYATWDEEKLRDALLVILNTHYTGGATGESFNRNGKVDILVRVSDRNVFVGECKWWTGAKSFAGEDADQSALDQLLSYTTWRDAKLALAIFVGNQQLSPVINGAQAKLEERKDVSLVRAEGEGQLRAKVKLPSGGEGDLAVVFVHLPKGGALVAGDGE